MRREGGGREEGRATSVWEGLKVNHLDRIEGGFWRGSLVHALE